MFIVLESADGGGKTATAAELARRNQAGEGPFRQGAVKVFRDPGTTPAGEALRTIALDRSCPLAPLSQTLLFLAARNELLQAITDYMRQDSEHIAIVDRWLPSTLAYQCGGNRVDPGIVSTLSRHMGHTDAPDLIFFLDTPEGVRHDRLIQRDTGNDRFEGADPDFKRRVNAAYNEFFDDIASGCAPSHHRLLSTLGRDVGAVAKEIEIQIQFERGTA